MSEKTEQNTEQTIFQTLSSIDVSSHVEQKNVGYTTLNYLSWSWAHTILMKLYGNDYQREWTQFDEINMRTGQLTGRKVNYCMTSIGAYVECTVTIKGHAMTETLPVMDNKNKAPIEPNLMEINKAQQRCFVKACALHGLGLNLYAGEDLPMGFEKITNKQETIIKDYCHNISKINGKGNGALYKEAILKCKIRDYKNMSKQDADKIIEYLANKLKDVAKQQDEQKEQEKVANTNE